MGLAGPVAFRSKVAVPLSAAPFYCKLVGAALIVSKSNQTRTIPLLYDDRQ
jgi:hypothetical protein